VRAAPDGYTLLYATTANASNATLYGKLNFNFVRDIAPIAPIVNAMQSSQKARVTTSATC
jgi:Tripartite tricarboxylate transporter family receptor